MKTYMKALCRALTALWALSLVSVVQAEDIDIYIGNDTANAALPNVLFVLDNTSNWARQSQQWPGGLQQGQSEVRAIQTALADQIGKLNVGLLEFTTAGTAGQDGAFVRFAVQELTAQNYATLSGKLQSIFDNVNGTDEKRNSGTPYGNLMRDVYSYLGGFGQSFAGEGTVSTLADSGGYSTAYSVFNSPMSSDSLCSEVHVIFIGNPNSSGPSGDSSTNSTFLTQLYTGVEDTSDKLAEQSTGTPLPIPLFSTTTSTSTQGLGYSTQCYQTNGNGVSDCTAAESASGGLCSTATGGGDCACSASQTVATGCAKNRFKLAVQSTTTTTSVTPTGEENLTAGASWNLDDWAKFLHDYGVPVTYQTEAGEDLSTRITVNTYAIDVFYRQQNAEHTGLLNSTANVGGGRYFAATNEDAIVDAIDTALSDILSESSTFAAVTLPLSATNRAQNENQVFIGMFRPDQEAAPRWFGNLKRYQLALFSNKVELADAGGREAINPLSGFADECAESFWSTNSDDYWDGLGVEPPPRSECTDSTTNVWSDLPDGPFVEKGGVAQVTRNSDIATRNLKTVQTVASLDSLTAFTSTYADQIGGTAVYDYFRGASVGVGETAAAAGGRPSIHGDVIHSRPLPINYGGDTGSVVFYGSNDGLLRAITATTGAERWALIAPEHFGQIERLYENSPRIAFPNQDEITGLPDPEPKGYFFDGSIGQIVRYDANDEVDLAYIFPTMRRGGRMVYALNVTDPDSPALLWRVGCPTLGSDVGCTEGFEEIGQTWSTPKSAYIKGYGAGATPVVIFGGGYDDCEDADSTTVTCDYSDEAAPSKGNAIYVVDAASGTLIRSFATTSAVTADISTVDVDFDGMVDYAYGVDTRGNIWRVNFVNPSDEPYAPLADENWGLTRVAYTDGDSRKFMNAPSLLAFQGKVYLALGSGNRERPLESNYPYASDVDDRFYVFLDYPASNTAVDLDGDQMNNATTEPACEAEGILPESDARGWYMSLASRGEQVVNPAAIAGGDVLFNTYKPGGTETGVCSKPLGLATAYGMSLFNGSACGGERSVLIDGGGMPIAPTLSTVNVTDPSCTGSNCPSETVTVCIGCEGLKPTEIEPTLDDTRKRIYWNSEIDR